MMHPERDDGGGGNNSASATGTVAGGNDVDGHDDENSTTKKAVTATTTTTTSSSLLLSSSSGGGDGDGGGGGDHTTVIVDDVIVIDSDIEPTTMNNNTNNDVMMIDDGHNNKKNNDHDHDENHFVKDGSSRSHHPSENSVDVASVSASAVSASAASASAQNFGDNNADNNDNDDDDDSDDDDDCIVLEGPEIVIQGNNKKKREQPPPSSSSPLVRTSPRRRVRTNDYGTTTTTTVKVEEETTKTNTNTTLTNTTNNYVIGIGTTFNKLFNDGEYYEGHVISGPEKVMSNTRKSCKVVCWRVHYPEDGDIEDLTEEEITRWMVTGSGGSNSDNNRNKMKKKKKDNGWEDDDDDEDEENEFEMVDDDEDNQKKKPAAPDGKRRMCSGDPMDNNNGRSRGRDSTSTDSQRKKGENSTNNHLNNKKKPVRVRADYETAKQDLCYLMGTNEEEVIEALSSMKPPYGMNEAMNIIHRNKRKKDLIFEDGEETTEKFHPKIGMRVRKNELGSQYYGTVTGDARWLKSELTGKREKFWEVTLDWGKTVEYWDWQDLLDNRASRPLRSHPVRGRQLCALELFSGQGIVTQEFATYRWRVRSIDCVEGSYATNAVDVMDVTYDDIGFVPDFIWASPPCYTYSRMAAGKHRSANPGQYEKTQDAHLNNRLLAKLYYIMRWARAKNPHLIVVIENPVGLLCKMPLMKEITDSFGLHCCTVDYCTLGRLEKKPTHIWTNDFRLHSTLAQYRCREGKCPYYNKIHEVSPRVHGGYYNSAAIPQALAEEVVEHVNSTFYDRRIRRDTKVVELSSKEVDAFDRNLKLVSDTSSSSSSTVTISAEEAHHGAVVVSYVGDVEVSQQY